MKITINYWNFHGLNQYIDANRITRGHWNKGNAMKQEDQQLIAAQLPRWKTDKPVWIEYRYFCPNRKRDLDNISGYFHKVFQDAMVSKKMIKNDDWSHIRGFQDEFYLDRNNPRVEVTVREVNAFF